MLTLASPARDIRSQIERGKERGVAFVTGFSDDPRDFGGDVGYGLDFHAAGELLGAYIVANGGGGVVIFDAPQLPQLTARLQGVKDYLAEHGDGMAEIIHEEDYSLAAGPQGQITKMEAILTRFPREQLQLGRRTFSMKHSYRFFRLRISVIVTRSKALHSTANRLPINPSVRVVRKWRPSAGGWNGLPGLGLTSATAALNEAEVGVNPDFPIQLTDETNVPPDGEAYDIGFDFKEQYRSMWDAAR